MSSLSMCRAKNLDPVQLAAMLLRGQCSDRLDKSLRTLPNWNCHASQCADIKQFIQAVFDAVRLCRDLWGKPDLMAAFDI